MSSAKQRPRCAPPTLCICTVARISLWRRITRNDAPVPEWTHIHDAPVPVRTHAHDAPVPVRTHAHDAPVPVRTHAHEAVYRHRPGRSSRRAHQEQELLELAVPGTDRASFL